jgi:digeranylgeranylglycerophospholipid reductase
VPLRDTMVCGQYWLAGIEIDPACACYTLSSTPAPGRYAWVLPKDEGCANVGIGVQADLLGGGAGATESAAMQGRGGVLGLLENFIESDPCLARGYPVTLVAGNVPVALAPARLVTAGLMRVGDAARQVDPLTGGGIINAMLAGRLAAGVAAEASAAGDTSAAALARDEEGWQQGRGRKLQRNCRLREKFPPAQRGVRDGRGDERFVRALALAAKQARTRTGL